jgi:ABC-type branched-subunit amino acid transport system substrate-binding protein
VSRDTIKVAILAPLSGPVPSFGEMTRDGALLAIEEWNAKGGVLGKKIIPVVEDSQCTPDPAVNAANKVIDQDRVKFIVGEVCSKASIPVSEIANSKKVIQISPTSTNPDVTVGKDGKAKATDSPTAGNTGQFSSFLWNQPKIAIGDTVVIQRAGEVILYPGPHGDARAGGNLRFTILKMTGPKIDRIRVESG